MFFNSVHVDSTNRRHPASAYPVQPNCLAVIAPIILVQLTYDE
jgi:hypothetical protein